MRAHAVPLSLLALPLLASSAAAQGSGRPTAVLHNLPGLPGSAVPGLGGVEFRPGGGSSAAFDRVYGSRNGHWMITAFADLPASEDEVVIVDGALVQREGQPAPWTGGVRDCTSIDRRLSINASGDFVFKASTNGSAIGNQFVVTNIGGAWGFAAREGDPIPALPGNAYGDALESPLIVDSGAIGFGIDLVVGPIAPSENEMVLFDDVVLSQQGVTVPPGQLGTHHMQGHEPGSLFVSADGSRWMVRGSLTADPATDDVVVVDGSVVLQDGAFVPGAGFAHPVAASGLGKVFMDAGGNWFARGSNAVSGLDWAVRNGDVVARTGAPVVQGAAELWDDSGFGDCFFLHVGNSLGDHVVGGQSGADPAVNDVLVLNGTDVVCRQGDRVDVDGDGLLDDFVINIFGPDDAHLSDDGTLLFVASLRSTTSWDVGQALISIDTRASIGANYCAAIANSTGGPASIAAIGSAVAADNDLELVGAGAPAGHFGIFLVSRTQGFTSVGAGTLCLGGAIGRYDRPGQIFAVDAAGRFRRTVDLAATPEAGGFTQISGGETWCFQGWFRDVDPVGGGATANWTDGVSVGFL